MEVISIETVMIFGLILIALAMIAVLAIVFSYWISDSISEHNERKYKESHPKFIWFREEYYKRNSALSSLCDEVRECCKEIDCLLVWINRLFPDTDKRKNLDDELYEQRKRLHGCMKELGNAKQELYEFVKNYAPPALAEIKYENSFDKWDKIYWNAKEKLAKMKSNVGSDILEGDL